MAIGRKSLPVKINLDKDSKDMLPNEGRYIKNMTPYMGINGQYDGVTQGFNMNRLKSLQANELYLFVNELATDSNNQVIGRLVSKETNSVFVFVYNDLGNHIIYRINGNQTYDIVYRGPLLNFIKRPEFFISETNATLEFLDIGNPETGEKGRRSFLFLAHGINYQRHICIEDSIATNSFNENQFPYFSGDYNKEELINMGLSTPKGCVTVKEVEWNEEQDNGFNNNLILNTWQFRVRAFDVWGRPSEFSIISDLYVPGINDCLSDNPRLSRCLDLTFDAGIPIYDKFEIAYRNCNSQVWNVDATINLYTGSNIGEWWLRDRNPDVNYSSVNHTITYRFCKNKECRPIPVADTNRLENPLPRQSQAITKIAKFIALGNNLSGFQPFSQELKSKIKFTVEGPKAGDNNNRNITIYVPIYNEPLDAYQHVFKEDTSQYYVYGGYNRKGTFIQTNASPRDYDQIFSGVVGQSGFGGYLVGGGATISTQVYVNATNEFVDDPNHNGFNLSANGITYQKFEFTNVPKGTYIFRLYSHLVNAETNDNYRNRSELVYGVCDFNPITKKINPTTRKPYKELLIDVCDGDYNSLNDNKVLVIADVAAAGYKATSGNILETTDGLPVELADVTSLNGYTSQISDHNGFYWFATKGSGRTFVFRIFSKCKPIEFGFREGGVGMRYVNPILTTIKDINFFTIRPDLSDYPDVPCNRIQIKGRLTLAGTQIGISNAVVSYTRSLPTITDADGNYTLLVHDQGISSRRTDKLIISASGCGYTGIDNTCIAVKEIGFNACASCEERIVNVEPITLYYQSQRGPLSGGSYGTGIVGRDWLGRVTFVQDTGYITIPTVIQSKAIAPSKIKVEIDADAFFPDEIVSITPWITQETTIEDYLSWIIDKVEFLDSVGNINNISPTKIKIYYDSINEFNKQNNFNTTTGWQFIPQGETTPRIGDKIEFYINGDGKYFDTLITSLVKYDQAGQYIIIDYSDQLKNLKQNALVRLIRPRECTSENQPYYEICHPVDIVNNRAVEKEFYLNFFDTYYLSREIPVPSSVNPVNTETISVRTTETQNADGSTTTTTQTTNETVNYIVDNRSFGFLFEHHSPSNFWGDKCKNIGRVNTKNPYETEIYNVNQIALSGALSVNGQLNYLNYFDVNKMTNLNLPNTTGGIVALIYEVGVVLIIFQYDQCTVGYDDNLGRVNSDGTFQAPSIDNQFGKPQRKIGNNNGCLLVDKNTISKWNGLVVYVDRTNADLIQHNFSQTESYILGQCASWFKPKLSEIQKDENKFLIGGINPFTNEYFLTDTTINNPIFINNERNPDVTKPETNSFDIVTREYRGAFSFIPEYYASLDSDILGKQFFTFKNGQPYSHVNINQNERFNIFYGEKVARVLHTVFVLDGIKKMRPEWIENYGNRFFVDRIITDSNQKSRILLDHWIRNNDLYAAPILCDLNTPNDPSYKIETGDNKILDGNPIHAGWIDMRFIGDPAEDEFYTQTAGMVLHVYAQTSTGEQ